LWLFAATVLISILLLNLPGRASIPPLVGSDYCYQLVAADRLLAGLGPTAPRPVAPLQPWEWQADWGFLTQWPIGYSLLVCARRAVTGAATIQACQWISVVAVSLALVGWFAWMKRVLPGGVTGTLLAAVAAGCSVSTAMLINPTTDVLLVAALPFVMLVVRQAIQRPDGPMAGTSRLRADAPMLMAGVMCGALVWIRYAAVFVPVAVAAYLLVERLLRRRVGLRQIGVFAVSAALPIATLLVINRAYGMASSVQSQLNLGHTTGFDFSTDHLRTAWWNFSTFGFYDYHWYSPWVFALWPLLVAAIVLAVRHTRRTAGVFLRAPGVQLSACVVIALLIMLVGVTTVFGGKYDYVSQIRYYAPVKPLYFLLFVTPLALIPARTVKAAFCVVLLVACSWTVRQEWQRPYERWLAANREVTPFGQWARCFEPGAAGLYRWLRTQSADNLIVVSNFHDHVTLETQIPALPIPPDTETLERWVQRIRRSRSITDPRVLFVLDRDNRWRDYWIKPTPEIMDTFGLRTPAAGVPEEVSAQVFEYRRAS
jgi:hypothetical protein